MPEFILKDKESPSFTNLNEFTQGYIEAMFFTEETPQTYKEEFESTKDKEELEGTIPADSSCLDIEPDSLAHIINECIAFQDENKDLLKQAVNMGVAGYDMQAAGSDFWYTRNGHGVGYWDRGLGDIGDSLSDKCGFKTKYKEVHIFFQDDKIHIDNV